MKSVLLVLGALTLTSCGVGAHHSGGPPSGTPPKHGRIAPPPAWIEASSGSHWLGYSSYCWSAQGTALCADMIAPSCTDDRTPRIDLRRGELVRFHLGFDPKEVSISVDRSRSTSLQLTREPTSHANREGVMLLFTRGGGGDAAYVACLGLTGSS
jgi:hypothetical protein